MMTLLLPGLARRRARTQACRVDMTLDDILLDALGDSASGHGPPAQAHDERTASIDSMPHRL